MQGGDAAAAADSSSADVAPVDAFATLATGECAQELALFLTSLRHHHPITPIYVAVTSELLDRIAATQRQDPMAADASTLASLSPSERRKCIAMSDLAHHLSPTRPLDGTTNTNMTWGNIHMVPLLDRYGPIHRASMEQRRGAFFPTQHCDFMMEKAVILEYALAKEQLKRESVDLMSVTSKKDNNSNNVVPHRPMVLFLDCDVCTLAPWPAQPASCPLLLSQHGIRPADEAMWGTFNGGVVGVRDPTALFEWRKRTLVSRFHDQASLEDVARWYLKGTSPAMEVAPDGTAGGGGAPSIPKAAAAAAASPASSSAHYAGAVALLGRASNYGYWRMFQPADAIDIRRDELPLFRMRWLPAAPATAVGSPWQCPPSTTTVPPSSLHVHPDEQRQHLLVYGEVPLQSVHTHFFQTGSSVAMPLFNRLLIRWMGCSQTRSYQHLLRLLV